VVPLVLCCEREEAVGEEAVEEVPIGEEVEELRAAEEEVGGEVVELDGEEAEEEEEEDGEVVEEEEEEEEEVELEKDDLCPILLFRPK
jgi:hypothetical protein